MPRWRGSAAGSVLHSSAIRPERRELVIQVFAPLTTYASPSRRATVVVACRSLPPPGSVSAIVARTEPVAILGRWRCFCSSVPYSSRSLATTVCPPIAPARLIQPRASSSVTSTKHGVETGLPPYSSGIASP